MSLSCPAPRTWCRSRGLTGRDSRTIPAPRGFVIHRYHPRIEGLFTRIERWTSAGTGEVHWRSITRDNITTLYGKDDDSRVSGPAGIFSWLICQIYNDKGNAIIYQYAAGDAANADLGQANERNRARPSGATSGVTTEYLYDLLTLCLTSQKTTRASDHARLQDLSYTYDPGGHITRIEDGAHNGIGAPEER
jgi:Salmonella virulence plasmid 65kDa B protein